VAPDFSVAMSPASATVTIGSSIVYAVTVTPSGTSALTVSLAVSGLPTGATASFSPASISGAGSSTLTISTNATVVAGTYTVKVTGTSGTLSHTASATLVALAPSADLAISTTASAASVTLGNNVTFSLSVTNNGPTGASGVVVSDTLPAGLSLVSVSATQGTCAGTTTVSCAVGSLAKGGSAVISLVARTSAPGTISNTASVRATEPDPNIANNTGTALISVSQGATADLVLTLAGSGTSVPINTLYGYTITLRNAGPSPATKVSFTDALPAGLWVYSVTGTVSGTCTLGSALTCTLTNPLGSGSSAQIVVWVVAQVRATVTNTVTARAAESDPNQSNNSGKVTTTFR
jgi:uncharacterized repeat protein (TIGR01451 family)